MNLDHFATIELLVNIFIYKDDATDIVLQLHRNARDSENKEMSKKFESEADSLEEAIEKYSREG